MFKRTSKTTIGATVLACVLLLLASSAVRAAEIDERLSKGALLLEERRYNEAIDMFRRGVELKREHAEGWAYLGSAYFGAGRFQDGLNAFEEALRLRSDHVGLWVGKGDGLVLLGRTDEALTVYSRAIEMRATADAAWYGKARCHALKAERDGALSCLTRAIELNGKLKNRAYRDRAFQNLWNDADFKKIIAL